MTDERIRVQIMASATEAIVNLIDTDGLQAVAKYGLLGDVRQPDSSRFSQETRLAMRESAHTAMIEAERLENQLNTPPEPQAPTLREAAENLVGTIRGGTADYYEHYAILNAAIGDLERALEAEGGDE